MKALILPSLFSALGILTGTQLAQEPTQEPAQGPSMLEMQMEMARLAQPGPEHEALAQGVGKWTVASKMTMPPMPGMEGMPPMETKATAVEESVLGGRFIRMTTTGSFMGQIMESIAYLGFDRRHGDYIMVAFDTMGTYFVTARGKRGEDGIIRMKGVDDDGYGGQAYTFEIDDSDVDSIKTNLYFDQLAGQDFDPPHKMVEVVQTRVEEE